MSRPVRLRRFVLLFVLPFPLVNAEVLQRCVVADVTVPVPSVLPCDGEVRCFFSRGLQLLCLQHEDSLVLRQQHLRLVSRQEESRKSRVQQQGSVFLAVSKGPPLWVERPAQGLRVTHSEGDYQVVLERHMMGSFMRRTSASEVHLQTERWKIRADGTGRKDTEGEGTQ